MLGWERWTLTHSSAGDAVFVLLPVLVLRPVLVLLLGLGLGLEAALTSSVAALVGAGLVAVAELAGEADMAGWLRLAEGDTDGVALADMAGWLADDGPAVDVDADSEGDAVVDGEGDGEADGDGEGDEVPCAGSTWHTVSVAAVASGTACALLAMPRARKLPLSRITAALTGGKRIRVACLR
jgi:hypothetical protein